MIRWKEPRHLALPSRGGQARIVFLLWRCETHDESSVPTAKQRGWITFWHFPHEVIELVRSHMITSVRVNCKFKYSNFHILLFLKIHISPPDLFKAKNFRVHEAWKFSERVANCFEFFIFLILIFCTKKNIEKWKVLSALFNFLEIPPTYIDALYSLESLKYNNLRTIVSIIIVSVCTNQSSELSHFAGHRIWVTLSTTFHCTLNDICTYSVSGQKRLEFIYL